jgi:hypothetical protein
MRGPPVTDMPALSLEGFRRVFGFHAWHFWGMADQDVLRVTADCPAVVKQYAWQNTDALGRSDIVEAIRSAERLLLDHLRYRPGAQWAEATMPWPRPGDRRMARFGSADPSGRWLSVALPEAEVQALGTLARTLIGTPAITYSDPNNDGVDELATITIATTVTDTDEIAAYFQASDRLYSAPVGEEYRIRPLTVAIAAGTATITAPAWLFVRPVNYETVSPQDNDDDLDPAIAGVLATAVEVYRLYTKPDGQTVTDSQGVLTWESRPCHGWWCACGCNGSTDPAAYAQAVARVGFRDAGRGVVIPGEAVYDATSATWAATPWDLCQEPDRVTVRYRAGLPLVNGDMRPEWATIVARLAAAELGRPICSCQVANRELDRWQQDLAETTDTQSFALSAGDLDCPWGTRRGHIQAWRWTQRRERVRAFTE